MSILKLWEHRSTDHIRVMYSYTVRKCLSSSELCGSLSTLECMCICVRAAGAAGVGVGVGVV
jgi:hypothetical protein